MSDWAVAWMSVPGLRTPFWKGTAPVVAKPESMTTTVGLVEPLTWSAATPMAPSVSASGVVATEAARAWRTRLTLAVRERLEATSLACLEARVRLVRTAGAPSALTT